MLRSPFRWIIFPLLFLAALAAGGWVVMSLWNLVLPEATGVRPLNFQQGLALLILCRLLFGGWRGGGRPGGSWKYGGGRARWQSMSEAERQALKEKWKNRGCN